MRYKFPVTITDIFERKVQKHVSGYGDNTVFSSDSAGWYIRIADHLSIYVGASPPSFKIGQKVFLQLRED